MPIYEFMCKVCCKDFSALRRTDSSETLACPACGAEKVVRMLSVTARTQSAGDTFSMPSSSCDTGFGGGGGCCGGGCAR